MHPMMKRIRKEMNVDPRNAKQCLNKRGKKEEEKDF